MAEGGKRHVLDRKSEDGTAPVDAAHAVVTFVNVAHAVSGDGRHAVAVAALVAVKCAVCAVSMALTAIVFSAVIAASASCF